jgi:hypothetical protein
MNAASIVHQYHQTIHALQKAKPRSNQRVKLQSKATELLTKILRKELREDRKRA